MTVRLGFLDDDLGIACGRAAAARIAAVSAGTRVEEVLLAPRGDSQAAALAHALVAAEIDAAAIPAPDLPAGPLDDLPAGTALAAILPRDEPWCALASPSAPDLVDLAEGALVAAASAIARAQVRAARADLVPVPLGRPLRDALPALDAGAWAALVLPVAALRALGDAERARSTFTATELTPEPGQGAAALLVRADDAATAALLAPADDAAARAECAAERTFVDALGAPPGTPVGALGRVRGARLVLVGVVATEDGARLLRLGAEGDAAAPEELGARLAGLLLRAGGRGILGERSTGAPDPPEDPR